MTKSAPVFPRLARPVEPTGVRATPGLSRGELVSGFRLLLPMEVPGLSWDRMLMRGLIHIPKLRCSPQDVLCKIIDKLEPLDNCCRLEKRSCWLTKQGIADKCHLSKRTVSRAILLARAEGYISVGSRQVDGTSEYSILQGLLDAVVPPPPNILSLIIEGLAQIPDLPNKHRAVLHAIVKSLEWMGNRSFRLTNDVNWLSRADIAEDAGVSRQTVYIAAMSAQANGWISIKKPGINAPTELGPGSREYRALKPLLDAAGVSHR